LTMPERTPLAETEARAGAVFVEDAGWLLPAHYGDAAGEYQHARNDAVVFDVSHRGKVEITGADAPSFLHNLCTNDILNLAAFAGCEAFLTTGQAKIVARALVYQIPVQGGIKSFWLDLDPGMATKVVGHLDHFLISERVELADRTAGYAQLHLAGPQALAVLRQAFGDIPELAELRLAVGDFGTGTYQVRRQDALCLPGYVILCHPEQGEQLWSAIVTAGGRPAGLKTYEVLRIEAGTPRDGVDLDENTLPQESGRTDRAISFTKGCYIGQETIARIRTYGHVNRTLVGLRLDGTGPVARGCRVRSGSTEVGQVTSSVDSPRLGTAIALAFVRRGQQEPGTALEVVGEADVRRAEVVALPF
jgi:folate-binding protein YgfZ